MNRYAVAQRTISEAVSGGGLLVVAQWEANEGQADNVADILDRFLPEAQSEPGVKLFLIGRNKENPAQFLFYELFRDEAAFKAHQEGSHFKAYIAGQALTLENSIVAGELGFEPRLTESESAVLPLNYSPIRTPGQRLRRKS